MLIFYQLFQNFRHQSLVLIVVVDVSPLLLPTSQCCRCFTVVGSGVSSCDCFLRLLRLVAGSVLSFSSSEASPLPKITYPFVNKFQQFIGTKRKLFKIFLEILFSKQVPVLSNRQSLSTCITSAQKNGTYL